MRPFYFMALLALATPAQAVAQDEQIPSSIDYDGFVELAGELGAYRQDRLLSWHEWRERAQATNAIILDTRSAQAFAQGHIAGAINLPFSDFTDDKLARMIGDTDRPIFIYCNNNFADDQPPVPLKRVELALNIPTFINLYGYGYRNIWELGETVRLADIDWVTPPG